MSTSSTPEDTNSSGPTELSLLKDRARMLGITFSNNISVETLKGKIEAKMNGDTDETIQAQTQTQGQVRDQVQSQMQASTAMDPAPVRPMTLREYLFKEEMRLVRVRITCMDDKKKDLPGEIFTVANEYLGTVRKFIPFGEKTDEGYHVPFCLLKLLKNRKFLQIKVVKDRNNREQISTRYVREFAIEELDPLTPAELAQLATAQQAAGVFTDD